ncbi:sugar phosphate nucleotidyltransferase [Flavobacteriaceae bacterium]|nr:sugar phosphate nucleotidyltransferase [Flavobacteriaceae bacterium]
MTDSIVIMAAGASTRMKKSTIDNSLSNEKVKEANNKSKALIEFGKKSIPFISYLLQNIIYSGFKNIYVVTSENDTHFRKNFQDILKIDLSKSNIFFPIQYIPINRKKPLGTADAILQTMNQFPELKTNSFCVCNGDNLYSKQALTTIRKTKFKNAFIAYDRDGLKFPKQRISSFAIAKIDNDNLLLDIIEKPSKQMINESKDSLGKIRVSMNLLKFDGEKSYSYFNNCTINKKRNEKEIPDVIKKMINEGRINIKGILISENVLDLTSKNDIVEVQKYII